VDYRHIENDSVYGNLRGGLIFTIFGVSKMVNSKEQEIPEGGNGRIHRADNRTCPFYDLGSGDFHSFVGELRRQNDLITELLNLVAGKNQVPMKIYIWSLLIVAASITGAKFIGEIFEPLHRLIGA